MLSCEEPEHVQGDALVADESAQCAQGGSCPAHSRGVCELSSAQHPTVHSLLLLLQLWPGGKGHPKVQAMVVQTPPFPSQPLSAELQFRSCGRDHGQCKAMLVNSIHRQNLISD